MARRRRRKHMGAKYMFNRMLFLVLLFAFAAGVSFYAKHKSGAVSEPVGASVSDTVSASEPDPASESEPESVPEPEPEASDKSESVPESAPEPGSAPSSGDWTLLLVNPSNRLPENYTVELEAITEDYRVDKRIADNVKRMFAEAKTSGINLTICSAYRSVEKQQSLFEIKEQEFIEAGKSDQEAVAATATIIAVPGTSEHHTGLAMDIVTPSYTELDSGFDKTPAFAWLDANAHRFGFVMRYPKDKQDITKIIYEPWHYRYVGEAHAARMKADGYCLEEYLGVLRGEKTKASAPASKEAEDGSEEDVAEPEEETE